MPTTIYDSSLITKRLNNKTVAKSFFTNTAENITPSKPYLGIDTASIVNVVTQGKIQEIRKCEGGYDIDYGCPCSQPSAVTEEPFTCNIPLNTLGDPDAETFEPIIQDGVLIGFNGVNKVTNNIFIIDNSITSIAQNAFSYEQFSKVTQLYINGTQITTLSVCIFSKLSSLNILILNNTLLSNLPVAVFNGLSSLNYLDLGYNTLLSILPVGIFNGLSSLHTLFLNYNTSLSSLPVGVFNGLSSLQILYLNNTGLISLKVGLFNGLTSLEKLYLYGNIGLTSLEVGLFNGLDSLQILILDNNNLTILLDGVFTGLNSLQNLGLNNNTGLIGNIGQYTFCGTNNLSFLNTLNTQLNNPGIYTTTQQITDAYGANIFDCPP